MDSEYRPGNKQKCICKECGAVMYMEYYPRMTEAEVFEKAYAYYTRLRKSYGGPEEKRRLILKDCDEEKIRRIHES